VKTHLPRRIKRHHSFDRLVKLTLEFVSNGRLAAAFIRVE